MFREQGMMPVFPFAPNRMVEQSSGFVMPACEQDGLVDFVCFVARDDCDEQFHVMVGFLSSWVRGRLIFHP